MSSSYAAQGATTVRITASGAISSVSGRLVGVKVVGGTAETKLFNDVDGATAANQIASVTSPQYNSFGPEGINYAKLYCTLGASATEVYAYIIPTKQ